jgi:hypothetical protein
MRTSAARHAARRRGALLGVSTLMATAGLAIVASSASALSTTYKTVYNNIPSPLPGNLPSEAFEAQSASEFGGQVQFAGTARNSPNIVVTMSTWGCESGHWYSGDCHTTTGDTFSEPITANVYAVNGDDSPGTLIGSVTHTFNIPYRPSANYTRCSGTDAGKWWHRRSNTCFNGKATLIKFSMGNIALPSKAIVSLAYNTTHYGYQPYGEDTPCYQAAVADPNAGGCGYDSLNVGLAAPPSVGSDPLPDDAYLNSSWTGAYCSGPAGTFRLDTGCWTGFQPAIKVRAR